MKSLNIPKTYTEVINRRRTGNTMTKRNKDKRTNNNLQNTTQTTTDWSTRTPLNTKGELMCSLMVISSWSTCDTRRTTTWPSPYIKRIGGVVVTMLVSSWFERWLGQRTDYKICIFCFSAKHAALRKKTGWFGSKIMCLSRATCLSTDWCFSELALYNSN
jgi:hypothetical protein